MRKKRVLFGHGWHGSPPWAPWLKEQLETIGIPTTILALPNPEQPIEDEWVKAIADAVGEPDEDTFFVTHSLGGMAVLRYLERLPQGKRVGGVLMVAGFSEWNFRPESYDCFKVPLNYEKVQGTASKDIVAIQSSNDPFVKPYEHHAEILRKKLGAIVVIEKDAGHFTKTKDDNRSWDELPEALTWLLGLMYSF